MGLSGHRLIIHHIHSLILGFLLTCLEMDPHFPCHILLNGHISLVVSHQVSELMVPKVAGDLMTDNDGDNHNQSQQQYYTMYNIQYTIFNIRYTIYNI